MFKEILAALVITGLLLTVVFYTTYSTLEHTKALKIKIEKQYKQ